jgi:hypothetical protein
MCPKALAFPPCFCTWACPPTELLSSATWRFFRDRSGTQPLCNLGTGTRLFTSLEEAEVSLFILQRSQVSSASIRQAAGPETSF